MVERGEGVYLAIFDDAVFEAPWRHQRCVFDFPVAVELFLCEVWVAFDEAGDCHGALGGHFDVNWEAMRELQSKKYFWSERYLLGNITIGRSEEERSLKPRADLVLNTTSCSLGNHDAMIDVHSSRYTIGIVRA